MIKKILIKDVEIEIKDYDELGISIQFYNKKKNTRKYYVYYYKEPVECQYGKNDCKYLGKEECEDCIPSDFEEMI